MKKPNGREGLPLAASDIEQGPYTVTLKPQTDGRKRRRYTLTGPTPYSGWWHNHEDAIAQKDLLNAAYLAGTKASTSEGDQLSEEGIERIVKEVYPWAHGTTNPDEQARMVFERNGIRIALRYLRDHGLLSDPRRSKMVEAVCECCGGKPFKLVQHSNVSDKWHPMCERSYHEFVENAEDVNRHEMDRFDGAYGLVTWKEKDPAAIGGEDGGGPLSDIEREVLDDQMEGLKHRLGASAETADRSTAFNLPEDGKDFRPPPLRARAQGPIDAVPAPKPTFKRTKP